MGGRSDSCPRRARRGGQVWGTAVDSGPSRERCAGRGVASSRRMADTASGSVGVRGSSPLGSTPFSQMNALIVEVDDQGVDHLSAACHPDRASRRRTTPSRSARGDSVGREVRLAGIAAARS